MSKKMFSFDYLEKREKSVSSQSQFLPHQNLSQNSSASFIPPNFPPPSTSSTSSISSRQNLFPIPTSSSSCFSSFQSNFQSNLGPIPTSSFNSNPQFISSTHSYQPFPTSRSSSSSSSKHSPDPKPHARSQATDCLEENFQFVDESLFENRNCDRIGDFHEAVEISRFSFSSKQNSSMKTLTVNSNTYQHKSAHHRSFQTHCKGSEITAAASSSCVDISYENRDVFQDVTVSGYLEPLLSKNISMIDDIDLEKEDSESSSFTETDEEVEGSMMRCESLRAE
eukprot:Sdes_comp10339_c0_seq1m1985